MQFKITRNKKVVASLWVHEVSGYGGRYQISMVRTDPEYRGQGFASELLKKAKANYGILIGVVGPDMDGGLSAGQIADWLKRHDFKSDWFPINGPRAKQKRCMIWQATK